jgi:hypothetical protein
MVALLRTTNLTYGLRAGEEEKRVPLVGKRRGREATNSKRGTRATKKKAGEEKVITKNLGTMATTENFDSARAPISKQGKTPKKTATGKRHETPTSSPQYVVGTTTEKG